MEQPDLWAIETERFAQGIQTICGVDEAGAGPLAGRVYAGAVILPKGPSMAGGLQKSHRETPGGFI